ncbi:MAG TPA: patatin-like phospholipase family protein [Bryobacteraceae bacterium]
MLSGGGMYGAYQAGAWKALADVFQPDLIVGTSIGALNGWAIAGGCEPGELIDRWLNLEPASRYRWKLPATIFGGVLDSEALQSLVREIHRSYTPKIDYALVMTDLLTLQPRIVPGGNVTWRHLLATGAIVGIFDQVRLDGRLCSDGGLLSALPVWAAAELGATKVLAINVLPEAPGFVAKTFAGAARRISSFRAVVPSSVEVITVVPAALLGAPAEMLYWSRANAEKWIGQGESDALALKHSIANCFERE